MTHLSASVKVLFVGLLAAYGMLGATANQVDRTRVILAIVGGIPTLAAIIFTYLKTSKGQAVIHEAVNSNVTAMRNQITALRTELHSERETAKLRARIAELEAVDKSVDKSP